MLANEIESINSGIGAKLLFYLENLFRLKCKRYYIWSFSQNNLHFIYDIHSNQLDFICSLFGIIALTNYFWYLLSFSNKGHVMSMNSLFSNLDEYCIIKMKNCDIARNYCNPRKFMDILHICKFTCDICQTHKISLINSNHNTDKEVDLKDNRIMFIFW